MKNIRRISIALGLLGLLYLLFAPTPLDPVAWQPPAAPEWVGPWQSNQALKQCRLIDLPGDAYAPESIAIDGETLVMSSHDGTLWQWKNGQFTQRTQMEGHPLGVEAAPNGLWIADATLGLVQLVDNTPNIRSQASESGPHRFVDDLAIADSGTVYFSDASRKHWPSSVRSNPLKLSAFDILEGRGHGRLYAYQPLSGELTLLVDDLLFANGVALSREEDFVLINETGRYRVLRHWIRGDKAGSTEVFIDNLPGYPDNITEAPDGGFWLALIKPRNTMSDVLAPYPFVRKMVSRLPFSWLPTGDQYGHVVKLSSDGDVLASLQDPEAATTDITSAIEHEGKLYLGSLSAPHFSVCDLSQILPSHQSAVP
ncbi:strictosidine synthase [gamma proteobacterium HTCC5015]|nr:strictosidine synthase [gamma proteobacterium HTCC5015]